MTIECRGGGGAGGSGTRTFSTGNPSGISGGGAGGNYARKILASPASGTYKVTVGGGGVSLTTVATNDTVEPGQQGGVSKFTDAADSEIAVATGGASGNNALVSTSTSVVLLGGHGVTTGSLGDAIFSGGDGGDAGGGGGAGAGDANDLTFSCHLQEAPAEPLAAEMVRVVAEMGL